MKLENLQVENVVELSPNVDCVSRNADGGYVQPHYTGTIEVDGVVTPFELEDTSNGKHATRYCARLGKEWSGDFGSMTKRADEDIPGWAKEIVAMLR